jgi:hypothetical protein
MINCKKLRTVSSWPIVNYSAIVSQRMRRDVLEYSPAGIRKEQLITEIKFVLH